MALNIPQTDSGAAATQDPLANRATANQLEGQRNQARRQRDDQQPQAGPQAPAQKKQDPHERPVDSDYPNPISFRAFLFFGLLCICQDVYPAVLDMLLGIGWIFGYVTFVLMWIAYWYFIIRRAPKSVRPKLWRRGAMVAGLELIPYVGEVVTGWTITALIAYFMVRQYQQGKGVGLVEKLANKAAGKALDAGAAALGPEAVAAKKIAEAGINQASKL